MKNLGSAKVLDSWALLAYFEGQEKGRTVLGILKEAAEGRDELMMSVVNWGEVLYTIESRHGAKKRDEVEQLMNHMPLELLPADTDLVREAARLKARSKLPYVDSFAAATAMMRKAKLVTGDKDFRAVAETVSIVWL